MLGQSKVDASKAVAPEEPAYQIWFLTNALKPCYLLMPAREGGALDFYPDEDLDRLL